MRESALHPPRVQLPFYLLMVFGCYALWTIGTDLINFGDCPDAAAELQSVRGGLLSVSSGRGTPSGTRVPPRCVRRTLRARRRL